jgi:hypothetical protein
MSPPSPFRGVVQVVRDRQGVTPEELTGEKRVLSSAPQGARESPQGTSLGAFRSVLSEAGGTQRNRACLAHWWTSQRMMILAGQTGRQSWQIMTG